MRILDGKTLEMKQDTGNVLVDNFVKAGSPVVPAGLKLPIEGLAPGTYKLEVEGAGFDGELCYSYGGFRDYCSRRKTGFNAETR